MDLQPLGDRLIVETLEEEETTSSGIVLPDTASLDELTTRRMDADWPLSVDDAEPDRPRIALLPTGDARTAVPTQRGVRAERVDDTVLESKPAA